MKTRPDQPAEQNGRPRWVAPLRLLLIASLLIGGTLGICWATGCMERLFYYPVAEPTPPPAEVPGAERVTFTSADGTRLVGWFLPAMGGIRPQDAPTILHTHGNAGSMNSHRWFTAYLPPAGFNVFIFDYRGYGESEGAARRRGPLIADTEAALDALLARDDVDADRIGLYGQSLGGAIGAVVMGRRKEIRAAVLESPFTSWRRIAADSIGGAEPNRLARGLAAMLISDDSRPIDALAAINRNVLVLHGTTDRTVPVSHSRAIAALGNANIEVVELEGGDHNSLRTSHPEIESMVIAFYRRHLGAAAAADQTETDDDE